MYGACVSSILFPVHIWSTGQHTLLSETKLKSLFSLSILQIKLLLVTLPVVSLLHCVVSLVEFHKALYFIYSFKAMKERQISEQHVMRNALNTKARLYDV